MKRVKIRPNFSVSLDEVAANGGLHEIFTNEGSVRFFLCEGESMSFEHKKLLVENKELNVLQVPQEQRKAFSKRIDDIASEIKFNK